jgi:DNA-binding LacI/PurR family transcriptional regulator
MRTPVHRPCAAAALPRDAVEHAIDELGYVPNKTAQSLAGQRRGSAVLAISSDDPALFANLFFAQVVTDVNAMVEETDLELRLVLAASDRGRARLSRIFRARGGRLPTTSVRRESA